MERLLFVGGIAAGQINLVDSRMDTVEAAGRHKPFRVGVDEALTPEYCHFTTALYRKSVLTVKVMVPVDMTDSEAAIKLAEGYIKGSKANDR